jgi:hypothetical protein
MVECVGFELERATVAASSVVHRHLRLGIVIVLVVAACAAAGCAQVEQRQQLAEPVGPVMRTPVGGTIATIMKDRDLPNAFGRADIYGRTVDAGFTRLIYRGRDADGSVLVEQINVDVQSNASTMTRAPVIYTGPQPAVASSRERGVAYGTSRTVSVASPADQVAMPLPGAAQFAIPKQRSLTLPTGQTVEFIAAERHELIFRIVGQGM